MLIDEGLRHFNGEHSDGNSWDAAQILTPDAGLLEVGGKAKLSGIASEARGISLVTVFWTLVFTNL